MITTIPDRERTLQAEVDALTAELARLRAVEPVAWKHDCAGLCTNDVELWIDACPHCGKPRAAPPAQPAEPVQRLSDEQFDNLVGRIAQIKATMTIDGVKTIGMFGAEEAINIVLDAIESAPKASHDSR